MANRKISQFITTTDITTVQGLAGYDATTNVQISGSALITSLEANLYKPFGNNGDVLTIVAGVPAWAAPGAGGNATMADVYVNSVAATPGIIAATDNGADLQLQNSEITFTAGAKGKFESDNALTLESLGDEAFLKGDTGVQLVSGTGITLESDSGNNQHQFIFDVNGGIQVAASNGLVNEVMLSNGPGNTVEWGKINLTQTNTSVSGVLSVQNGGTGVGSLSDGRLVVGGNTNALSTITSDGKGKLVVGRTVGVVDSTGIIPVGADGQVLTADSTVAEYGVKWATPAAGGGDLQSVLDAGNSADNDPAAVPPTVGTIDLTNPGGADVTYGPGGIKNNSNLSYRINADQGTLDLDSSADVTVDAVDNVEITSSDANVVVTSDLAEVQIKAEEQIVLEAGLAAPGQQIIYDNGGSLSINGITGNAGDVITSGGAGQPIEWAPALKQVGQLTATMRDLGATTANDEFAHFTPDLNSINTNFGGIAIPADITITKIQAKYLGLTADPMDTNGAGNEFALSLEEIDSGAAIDTAIAGEITALLTTPSELTYDFSDNGTWPYKEWTGSVSATGGKILRLKQVRTAGADFADQRDVSIIISYEFD